MIKGVSLNWSLSEASHIKAMRQQELAYTRQLDDGTASMTDMCKLHRTDELGFRVEGWAGHKLGHMSHPALSFMYGERNRIPSFLDLGCWKLLETGTQDKGKPQGDLFR